MQTVLLDSSIEMLGHNRPGIHKTNDTYKLMQLDLTGYLKAKPRTDFTNTVPHGSSTPVTRTQGHPFFSL